MTQVRVLTEVLEILERLGIPYMIVGSFASGFHGEFRATQDADLVIDPTPDQLRAFLTRVSEDFYVSPEAAADALARRGQFNLVHFETAWKIDLIIRKKRPFSEVEFARRQEGSLGGRPAAVNSPEDVILSKLEWARASGSERQLGDAAGVVAAWGDRLDWDYLVRWAEDLEVSDLLARIRR
ncbi:MAG: hypothetical protein M5U22_08490 [Thermoleophilia bacterium]|nr:hypothetical protein [Thermoleophilia bacterium]